MQTRVTRDPHPKFPSAGLKNNSGDQTAGKAIFPQSERSETPEHIKKYRKSFKHRHGQTIQHYGHVGDPMPQDYHRYGLAPPASYHTGDVLGDKKQAGINGFVIQIKEQKYDSTKRAPIGQTITRNYNLPQQAKQQQFMYGVETAKNQFSCKQILTPGIGMQETQQNRTKYLKSHKSFGPGEQIDRKYNWPVQADDFRFGKIQKPSDNINQIMKSDAPVESFPITKIVQKNQMDHTNFKFDHLGKPANLGQANKYTGPDFVYGKKLQTSEWDAKMCLRGNANMHQVRQDQDLGKTTRPGFRNITKPGDQDRAFGVPNLRTDIEKPAKISVADTQNYGTDPKAIQLIYPESYQFMGLTKQDFDMRRPKQQIRGIFARIGRVFPPGQFEVIFEKAKELQVTILDKVSCSCFLKAMREVGIE